MHRIKSVFAAILIALLTISPASYADELNDADQAIGEILFEYEGGDEFATYVVDESGFVNINFASDMPNALYIEILDKMEAHPKIDGVLAGKSGPVCGLFPSN